MIKRIFFIFLLVFQIQAAFLSGNQLIEMGRGSYGNPAIFSWGEGAKVKVGKFCSIADGVQIFVGGNHRPDWITTYPFNVLRPHVAGHITGHPMTKGDVIIGNDETFQENIPYLDRGLGEYLFLASIIFGSFFNLSDNAL